MNRRRFLANTAGAAMTAVPGHTAPGWAVPPKGPARGHPDVWPNSSDSEYFLEIVQETIADIANTIAAFEPVILLADPDQHSRATALLGGNVTLWDIPTEDLWARDAGPLITRNAQGNRAVSHIRFNGWGGKQVHTHDAHVTAEIATRLGLPLIDSGLRGEAGAADHDGHGLLIAHESSWVTANRNPGLSREEIETRLLAAYGAARMIWAPGVRDMDITDYHIDSLARFTGPGRVLINLPDAPDMSDPFHRAALQTHDILHAAGLDITVIPDPVKPRVQHPDFVASYVNFYVCNGAVIASRFGDRDTDHAAARALARHYPGREVIQLDTDPLGELGGGIHCATQQLPAP